MKSQDKIICKVCELECKTLQSLGHHIKKHNLTSKEYYDMYFMKENEDICPECNKETNFLTFTKGYSNFCSTRCSTLSKKTKDKLKKTNFEKYGVEYSQQSKIIKDKIQQTMLEKYGVNSYMKTNEFREKSKEVCKERYGCEYPSQSEEIKEKIKQSNLNNNGVEYPMQSDKVKEKSRKTCQENYGVDNPSKLKEIREKAEQTMLEKYGSKNSSQCKEIFEKQQQSAFKYKEYILPSGDIRKVQGYEPYAIDLLIEQKYDEEDILTHRGVPTIKYCFEDKNRVYYPDIYIPSENLIIEVKSEYTYKSNLEKNLAKQRACLDQGYRFEFWILDNKGNILNNNWLFASFKNNITNIYSIWTK